jgi:hypothetical protein
MHPRQRGIALQLATHAAATNMPTDGKCVAVRNECGRDVETSTDIIASQHSGPPYWRQSGTTPRQTVTAMTSKSTAISMFTMLRYSVVPFRVFCALRAWMLQAVSGGDALNRFGPWARQNRKVPIVPVSWGRPRTPPLRRTRARQAHPHSRGRDVGTSRCQPTSARHSPFQLQWPEPAPAWGELADSATRQTAWVPPPPPGTAAGEQCDHWARSNARRSVSMARGI